MITPGFLSDGIDFEQLFDHYVASGHYIEITEPTEVNLAIELMEHVINSSYEYNEEDSFAKTKHGRFQMILNSTMGEVTISRYSSLIKKSGAVWLLGGSYEKGTDFISNENVEIEAKVYKNIDSLNFYAKKGSVEYTVFHGAEYVLCYLIDSYEGKHWHWLKKNNGVYDLYQDEGLEALTVERLPQSIPICYCKIVDNKIIIGKNKYCK